MSTANRRGFLLAAATSVPLSAAPEKDVPFLALSDRAHFSAHPSVRKELVLCFSRILGCGDPATFKVPGLAEPIYAFRFPDGGSVSIEFTEEALSADQARRGAWLEIRCNDPAALKEKILAAGFSQVSYLATNTFYFAAPGGQVFGIVPSRNPSVGELKNG